MSWPVRQEVYGQRLQSRITLSITRDSHRFSIFLLLAVAVQLAITNQMYKRICRQLEKKVCN
jgi:hypothetical protein